MFLPTKAKELFMSYKQEKGELVWTYLESEWYNNSGLRNSKNNKVGEERGLWMTYSGGCCMNKS